MLPHDEWLQDAKNAPLGGSNRVYHGAERRRNLVVYNNADSWSCWCHACSEGAKVYKQVLQPVKELPVVIPSRFYNVGDTVTLDELARQYPDEYKRVVKFLAQKNMSTVLLRDYNPRYHLTDMRLVFLWQGAAIGRDITGRNPSKWYRYYTKTPIEYIHLVGSKRYATGVAEVIVLVEDLFSAFKVQQYTGLSTLCCLGTNIHDSIVHLLTCSKRPYLPVLAFDGDSAGRVATRKAAQRLGLRGATYEQVTIPDGLDPKDLDHIQLQNLFRSYL